MFVLAASDARSAYKELGVKMQLRLASHLIDGLVDDKNVMLMPAFSPPARAALQRRVPTLLPASALQSTARFGPHLLSWRGAGAAGARCKNICIDAVH